MALRLPITVEESAVALGIGRRLAHEALHGSELPFIRIGRRILIPHSRSTNCAVPTSTTNRSSQRLKTLRRSTFLAASMRVPPLPNEQIPCVQRTRTATHHSVTSGNL